MSPGFFEFRQEKAIIMNRPKKQNAFLQEILQNEKST